MSPRLQFLSRVEGLSSMALSSSSLLAALPLFGRSLSPGSGCSAFCAEVGALQSRFVLVIRLSLGVTGRGATETGTGSLFPGQGVVLRR